MFVLKSVIILL